MCEDRNVTAGEYDSLRTGLCVCVCARALACVSVCACTVGVVFSHTQPVEGPLAPDISTGLAVHSTPGSSARTTQCCRG